MSEHSVFAFSASPRWIPCPGSMAYPENTAEGDAGVYAAEGTAAHELAALCLRYKQRRAEEYIGSLLTVGKRGFEVTEEFAGHVQTYVDDVRRRAIGGYLLVEHRVSLVGIEGFDGSNYGTSDAIISQIGHGIVCDLKFGMGEKVYAWERAKEGCFTFSLVHENAVLQVTPNYQLMMYALAALRDLRLFGNSVTFIRIVINQPRLGWLSEADVPVSVLMRFAVFAADALKLATNAMGFNPDDPKLENWLNPGDTQCRILRCRALARCPAAAKRVQKEIAAEFDVIAAEPPTLVANPKALAKAMLAVPFIQDWCRAVMSKAHELVTAGVPIIGPDDKPYKFVEGKQGNREWQDPIKAEAALLGVLPPEQAYKPREIRTAAGAAKLLDKKATAQMWKDVFVPLIKRAPGKPLLVLGSDPRLAYSPASSADEFDIEAEGKS